MFMRFLMAGVLVAGISLVTGCSGESAGSSGFNIGKNLLRKDTNLKLWLDGQQATQSALKKGLSGYASFKINEPISTSPVFKYSIIEAKKFGYIKNVSMAVHQKFEADFSDIADYTIFPKTHDDNMKPDTEYDLGNLGPSFKIMDRHDKEVDKVEFRPGWEYLLVFVVSADKSESIQIYFKTK